MNVASQLSTLGFIHYYIVALCLVCALTDIKTGKILNRVTYPSILVGLLYNAFFVDHGVPVFSLFGLAVGIIPFGFAAWRGWIGGGDVKLFGAIGAIGGVFLLVDLVFTTFVLSGTYSLGIVVVHIVRRRTKKEASWFPRGHQIRLGVFAFIGSVLTVLNFSFIRYLQELRSL